MNSFTLCQKNKKNFKKRRVQEENVEVYWLQCCRKNAIRLSVEQVTWKNKKHCVICLHHRFMFLVLKEHFNDAFIFLISNYFLPNLNIQSKRYSAKILLLFSLFLSLPLSLCSLKSIFYLKSCFFFHYYFLSNSSPPFVFLHSIFAYFFYLRFLPMCFWFCLPANLLMSKTWF